MVRKADQVKCRKCNYKYRPKEYVSKKVMHSIRNGWRVTVVTICPKCGHEN